VMGTVVNFVSNIFFLLFQVVKIFSTVQLNSFAPLLLQEFHHYYKFIRHPLKHQYSAS
jgi:hypothetical protein